MGEPTPESADAFFAAVKRSRSTMSNETVRRFETGATRSSDNGKPDYEGYLSPLVIREFGRYMTKHRLLPDGSMRDSDNWQKGIPRDQYIKSLWRHFVDLWTLHRGIVPTDEKGQAVDLSETLSAIMFNTMGYFHEHIKADVDLDKCGTVDGVTPLPEHITGDFEYDEAKRLAEKYDGQWNYREHAIDAIASECGVINDFYVIDGGTIGIYRTCTKKLEPFSGIDNEEMLQVMKRDIGKGDYIRCDEKGRPA